MSLSSSTSASVLTARGPEDVLGVVPYMIGFHPRDSVVVLFVEASVISAAARIDLADAAVPGRACSLLAPLLRQVGAGWQVVLIGYGDDPDGVGEVVAGVAAGVPVETAACLVVCGGLWWDLDAAQDRRVFDPAVSRIAAEATFCGVPVVADRAELESLFHPGGRVVSSATLRAAASRVGRLSPAGARDRLGVLLDRQLDAAGPVSVRAGECAELVLLLDVAAARDAFWLRLNRASGARLLRVWLDVAGRVPQGLSLAAVCAAGLAAWQGSPGALVTVALERADVVGGRHPLRDILGLVHGQALPPTALDGITARVAG